MISFSVYLLSKASRNHAEMNSELVAYDFIQFEVLYCGIRTSSLEKFDSDVARICQSFDAPQLQAEDNGGGGDWGSLIKVVTLSLGSILPG